MMYEIVKEEDPVKTMEFLEERLYEHNANALNKSDGDIFAWVVKNKNADTIAGIAGWTWAGACEISQLWVDKTIRKKGVGKELLKQAEEAAKNRGCTVILIRSYAFQAPHFYEKAGYKTVFVQKDFPKGHDYYILTKQLS